MQPLASNISHHSNTCGTVVFFFNYFLETKEVVVRNQIQINAKDQDEDFPNDAAVAGVASVSSKVP